MRNGLAFWILVFSAIALAATLMHNVVTGAFAAGPATPASYESAALNLVHEI